MVKKTTQKIITSLVLMASSIQAVFAAEETPQPVFNGGENPTQTGVDTLKDALGPGSNLVSTPSLRDLVVKYVNFSLPFLALAAFVGFVYAGFLYVTAFGNEEQTKKANKVMIYAVVGIFLVILSYSIVQFFTSDLAQGIQK